MFCFPFLVTTAHIFSWTAHQRNHQLRALSLILTAQPSLSSSYSCYAENAHNFQVPDQCLPISLQPRSKSIRSCLLVVTPARCYSQLSARIFPHLIWAKFQYFALQTRLHLHHTLLASPFLVSSIARPWFISECWNWPLMPFYGDGVGVGSPHPSWVLLPKHSDRGDPYQIVNMNKLWPGEWMIYRADAQKWGIPIRRYIEP